MTINGFKIIDEVKKNGRYAYRVICPHCKLEKVILKQTIDGRKSKSCGCLINLSNVMPIKGYENYTISKQGEVVNTTTKKAMIATDNGKGYKIVGLSKNNKRKNFYVHRLVAEAFIKNENQEKFLEVNHIDGDKSNNEVHNLEWIDRSGNIKHCYRIGARKMSEYHKERLKEGARRRNEELKEHRAKRKKDKETRIMLNKKNMELRSLIKKIHDKAVRIPDQKIISLYEQTIDSLKAQLIVMGEKP